MKLSRGRIPLNGRTSMAKETKCMLMWIPIVIGKEWDIPAGWQVDQLVLPIQDQTGKILVLLRGTEK